MTGLRTYLPSAPPIGGFGGLALLGCLSCGIATGLGFGVGRAIMPLARGLSGAVMRWDQAFDGSSVAMRWLLTASSVIAALAISRAD